MLGQGSDYYTGEGCVISIDYCFVLLCLFMLCYNFWNDILEYRELLDLTIPENKCLCTYPSFRLLRMHTLEHSILEKDFRDLRLLDFASRTVCLSCINLWDWILLNMVTSWYFFCYKILHIWYTLVWIPSFTGACVE